MGEMKVDVYREVNAFAESKGKVPITISTKEAPVAWGKYASFELRFKLIDKNDPEALNAAANISTRPTIDAEKAGTTPSETRTKDEIQKRPDLYTEITKLDDLRKKKLITDAEFEAQKQKLLNGAK